MLQPLMLITFFKVFNATSNKCNLIRRVKLIQLFQKCYSTSIYDFYKN